MKPYLLFLLACLCGSLLLSGCQSASKPGNYRNGAVEISGHPLAEVQRVTIAVFLAEDYRVADNSPGSLVFERPGSKWDNAKYGGLNGQGVTLRAKVRITELRGGVCRVKAEAYVEENSDDDFFRTENRILSLSGSSYKSQLLKVAKILAREPAQTVGGL